MPYGKASERGRQAKPRKEKVKFINNLIAKIPEKTFAQIRLVVGALLLIYLLNGLEIQRLQSYGHVYYYSTVYGQRITPESVTPPKPSNTAAWT